MRTPKRARCETCGQQVPRTSLCVFCGKAFCFPCGFAHVTTHLWHEKVLKNAPRSDDDPA